MRYSIDFDKLANRLTPHYIGGKKYILFMQSCLAPLRGLNDAFVEWCKELPIEMNMTSQVFKLEWFLNKRFGKYFKDPTQRIYITNRIHRGTAIYSENADIDPSLHLKMKTQEEGERNTAVLKMEDEVAMKERASFTVSCPEPSAELISETQYTNMITSVVNRYRIATKTFLIDIQR